MTVNTVLVTVQADNAPGDPSPAEGNVVAIPSGTQWPDASGNPIVPELVHGYLGDLANGGVAGQAIIQLVASDNFSVGVLNWDFVVNIRGFPTVNVSDVPVNFSSGANQNFWTIIAAAGWTPPEQP
jgi:hypothetical protein